MNILIIGDDVNFKECQQKFGDVNTYSKSENHAGVKKLAGQLDVIFDFIIDRDQSQIKTYKDLRNTIIFLNTAKVSLAQLSGVVTNEISCPVFGFAGLPTFLNRLILETSVFKHDQKYKLQDICKKLGTEFQVVEDRVGLVTPRVICMIINEAYFTVEEGTATREDIDLAMKLGTNYPYGPFEWAQKIGVNHVYELLASVYEDTKDERYTICPLLKKEYLRT